MYISAYMCNEAAFETLARASGCPSDPGHPEQRQGLLGAGPAGLSHSAPQTHRCPEVLLTWSIPPVKVDQGFLTRQGSVTAHQVKIQISLWLWVSQQGIL